MEQRCPGAKLLVAKTKFLYGHRMQSVFIECFTYNMHLTVSVFGVKVLAIFEYMGGIGEWQGWV